MPDENISVRQLMVLLFTALLSPAVRVLPAETAAAGGRAGWLSTLLALPAGLALCWALSALLRRLPGGMGLAEACVHVLGRPLGKALTAVYLLWGIFLLAANTRLCGLRFLSTGYRNGPLGLFLIVLLAVVLWLTCKKLPAFARAGEIFYLALAAVLGLTLLFSLPQVEAANLLPIWVEDLPGAGRGALPALALLGYGIYGAFLMGAADRRPGDRRRALGWTAAFCLTVTALQAVCLGAFGPGLAERMETPFFMLARGIGVRGAFERVESVVVSFWILSDLVFLGLLVYGCCAASRGLLGLKSERTAALPVTVLGLLGALFLFPDAFSLRQTMERTVLAGNLILGFGVPLALLGIAAIRGLGISCGGQAEGHGISCEEKGPEKKMKKNQKKC